MAQGSKVMAMRSPDRRIAPRENIVAAALLAIAALTPVIFALTSWQPAADRGGAGALVLFYSLPVTAIEFGVVLYALRSGFSVKAALVALPPWARWALTTLVVVAFAMAMLALQPGRSMLRTVQAFVHLLFALGVFHLFTTQWASLRPRVWAWVVAGCCLYGAILAAWVARVMADPGFDWAIFGLAVTNVRQLGFYSAVGASAAIGLAAMTTTPGRYAAAIAAASAMVGLSCWSGTRGSLLAIGAAYAAAASVFPALRRRRALLALALSAVFGMALSLIVFMPDDPRYGLHRIFLASQAGDVDVSSGRLEMWRATLRAVMERPLFGYGEGQFGLVVAESNGFNHPHNIVLQILLHWGVVGFACCLSLALLAARPFLAAARASPGTLPAVLVVTAMLAMSLYEGSLYHPYPIMMFAMAAAFVIASGQRDGDSARA